MLSGYNPEPPTTRTLENYMYNPQPLTGDIRRCYQGAVECREEGNKKFRKSQYNDAQKLYTQSIEMFPDDLDDEQRAELAKSYANRATTSYHMKEFMSCIRDVERAFSLGYPDDLKYKLYEKQGNCYRHLKEYGKAIESMNAGLDALNIHSQNPQKMLNIKDDMKKQLLVLQKRAQNSESASKVLEHKGIPKLIKCQSEKSVNASTSVNVAPDGRQAVAQEDIGAGDVIQNSECASKVLEHKGIPKLTKCRSEKFVNASTSVNVTFDEAYGRQVVAEEDIEVGDVIIVDKAFASVLYSEFYDNNCYYCFKYFKVSLLCNRCSRVRYCSEECKTKAWLEFHERECCVLDYIVTTENDCDHLAHRLIVKLGYDNLVKFRRYLQTDGATVEWNKFGVNPGDVINSSDFMCVRSLLTHSNYRNVEQFIVLSMVAVYLLKCLQEGSFFPEDVAEDMISFTGSLLLSLIQIVGVNSFGVNSLLKSSSYKENGIHIGGGLHTTASLLNHSCDPNVITHSYGDVFVIRASRKILKGEQIMTTFGPHFQAENVLTRNMRLMPYYFKCHCTACTEHWPSDAQATNETVLKCQKCSKPLLKPYAANMIKCENCGTKQNVSRSLQVVEGCCRRFFATDRRLERGEKIDVRTIIEDLSTMDRMLRRPSKILNEARRLLIDIYDIEARNFLQG